MSNPASIGKYTLVTDANHAPIGLDASTGTCYMLSWIPKAQLDDITLKGLHAEMHVAKQLESVSDRMLLLVDMVDAGDDVYLFYTRANYSSNLLQHLNTHQKLTEEHAQLLCAQILDCVRTCHDRGIVVRDLKLPSLLLDSTATHVWLSDFRHAAILESPEQTLCDRRGSPAYISPEMISTKPYSGFAVDMWCLGVILYKMLCGVYPFYAKDLRQLFHKIKENDPFLPPHLSADVCSLLRGLLNKNPLERLTAEQAAAHPWLRAAPPTAPSYSPVVLPHRAQMDCDQLVPLMPIDA